MNIAAAKFLFPPDRLEKLSWSGDNRKFIIEILLPRTPGLSKEVVQVIRWAYGYDGSDYSFELRSDGSSDVPDLYLGGLIKEPFGVAHDWLFFLHHNKLADPSGHVWTLWQANWWYFKACKQFGYPRRAIGRFIGLTLASWFFWLR